MTPREIANALLAAKRQDLRLARIEHYAAAAKFTKIADAPQRPSLATYEEHADALDAAARAFVNAELAVADAERVVREIDEADRLLREQSERKRTRRTHLSVVDGGE